MSRLRVSFDIGGVLSKYPDVFGRMIDVLMAGGAEVFVLTDMRDRQHAVAMLERNGIGVPSHHVVCCDYDQHGERCKQVEIERLDIDVHVDDFAGYWHAAGAADGCVSLLTCPDPDRPYWADGWRTDPKDGEFGRRRPKEMP